MATYEGKWRCLHCQTANPGRNLNCQTCGVKRNDDVEFFLEDVAAAVEDEKLLHQAHAGTDWICRYCSGNNRADSKQCSSCGSLRSEEDHQLIEETRGINDWSEEAQKAAALAAALPAAPARPSFFRSRLFKFLLLGFGGLTAFFIAVFALLIYLSTLTYPLEIEVTGLEWSRTVALEEYRTVSETAWEGEVPQNARVQSKETALHHTDKVPNGTRTVPETYTEQVPNGTESYVCGKTSKKNGYFTDKYCTRTKYTSVTKTRNRTETIYRDVPVYKTRYTYLIDKWMPNGEKSASGTDFNPQWANVPTDATHRTGTKTESYNLLCKELGGNNKTHKIKLTAENWMNFQNGAHLHGKINFFNKMISIDELPNGEW